MPLYEAAVVSPPTPVETIVASTFRLLAMTGMSLESTCTHLSSPRNGSSGTLRTDPPAVPMQPGPGKVGSQGRVGRPDEARKPTGCPGDRIIWKSATAHPCT